MGVIYRCDRCHNSYSPDEAPGILCPLCQAKEDTARPEIAVVALAIVVAAIALLTYGR